MKDKVSRFRKGIRHRPRKPEAETGICLPCVTCVTCVTFVMPSPDPGAATSEATAVSEDLKVLDQDTTDMAAEAAEAAEAGLTGLTGDF